ncbi:MAG TPA: 50S ribosomal protein L25/general stress protein Ctc [Bacteroidia bacterium]|nr:50S ribosomal protein L25/general stress protein Ctc [Bacteroidia bacterium]HNS11505.1 50S ribosomal protein L25/general stress protein Ctc [Bacteroidia bacterium]
MKSIAINGTKRAAQSKQETKKLRAEGMVPCVLYGGKEQYHFSTPAMSLKGLVYTPEVYTVELNLDGNVHKCMMKDIQFHAVTDKILHIDFLELSDDKKVNIQVPVRVTGNSPGVRAGGVLVNKLRRLKIAALPKHLPDSIEIKIDEMEIGDDVRVRDMKMAGVEFLDSPSNVITAVKTTRVVAAPVEAAPVAAAAAAPAEGAAAAAPAKDEKKK